MTKNQIQKQNSKSRNQLPHSIDLRSLGPPLPQHQQFIFVFDSYFYLPTSVIPKVSKAFPSDLLQKQNISEQLIRRFKIQLLPNSHTAKSNSSATKAQNGNSPTIVNISNVPPKNSDN